MAARRVAPAPRPKPEQSWDRESVVEAPLARRGRRQRARSVESLRSRTRSAEQLGVTSLLSSDVNLNHTSHSHPGTWSSTHPCHHHHEHDHHRQDVDSPNSAHRQGSQRTPDWRNTHPSLTHPSLTHPSLTHQHGTTTPHPHHDHHHDHHHHQHYHSDQNIHHHHHHNNSHHHHHHRPPIEPDPPPRRRRHRSHRSGGTGSQTSLPSSSSSSYSSSFSSSASSRRSRSSSVPGQRSETLNLSLCGCGFLGVYHLGVVSCLLKHGPSFLARVDRVAGASAGALAAALLVTCPTLKTVETSTEMVTSMAKTIRRKPLGAITPGYRMANDVEQMLDKILPPDAHEIARGKLHVSLTDVKTKENVVMSDFESRKELIEALVASCHIPVYSGAKFPVVKGKHYCDGGLTDNLVCFKDGHTVTVSPFSGKQDIGPRDHLKKGTKGLYVSIQNLDMQVNLNNIRRASHAFFPPRTSILQQYLELGHKDASRFLVRQGLYEITKPGDKPPLVYESSV